MPGDDDVDFDAFMRARGIERMDGHDAPRTKGERAVESPRPAMAAAPRAPSSREREELHRQIDAARAALVTAVTEGNAARSALATMETERDAARDTLARVEAERLALTKERAALQRQLSATPPTPPAPSHPSLRQVLADRGAADEAEAADLLLTMLGREPSDLLDGVQALPVLAERLETQLVMVCERPECQPSESVAMVRVSPERCDVCGGSDIRAAFEILLRASRLAGITRLVIVGGSPPYHTQLRALCRGTDLKLDLVSGRSKPGRRRARSDVERVVIWGSTILDHGTSAAYEHLGDRLIRVTHRGISGMLREVAETLG